MAAIPKRVAERLVEAIKKYQPIIAERAAADAGEADTVILVTDLLADVFGYDKFKEITAQFPVKTTYCDLATRVDELLQTLIEVKAIGHELKDSHVVQAVNYAANQGVKWVLLTNGQYWRAYAVKCAGQVDSELVLEFDFLKLDRKSEEDIGLLYLLCKEGWAKSVIDEYEAKREALSRFIIGAVILSKKILATVRTELRRISPDVHFSVDDIKTVIENDVLKRDLLDGERADSARKMVARAAKTAQKETA